MNKTTWLLELETDGRFHVLHEFREQSLAQYCADEFVKRRLNVRLLRIVDGQRPL